MRRWHKQAESHSIYVDNPKGKLPVVHAQVIHWRENLIKLVGRWITPFVSRFDRARGELTRSVTSVLVRFPSQKRRSRLGFASLYPVQTKVTIEGRRQLHVTI